MSRRRFAPVHTVALNVTYRGRKISVSPSWEFPGFWQASTLMFDGKMYSFYARSALVAFCGLRDNYIQPGARSVAGMARTFRPVGE